VETRYDPRTDVFEVWFGGPEPAEADEVRPGIELLHDDQGRLAGVRVLEARARLGERLPAEPAPARAEAITVYTDGACLGNPGPGGWAVRLRSADGRTRDLGGAVPATTNNRMELLAAIQGLREAAGARSIALVTDSEYLRRGITEWIKGWKRNGWLTVAKKPVLNQDLWQELDRLNGPHVTWRYTRGHAGDPDNEHCDRLAQAYARGNGPGA
jgi:ribonuclease HI